MIGAKPPGVELGAGLWPPSEVDIGADSFACRKAPGPYPASAFASLFLICAGFMPKALSSLPGTGGDGAFNGAFSPSGSKASSSFRMS